MKLGYATIGSNRLEETKAFYDALFGAFGIGTLFDHDNGGRMYGNAGPMFAVLVPFNGKSAAIGNGAMVGFAMDSTEEVAAIHAKALALGGTNEGDPGERGPGAYAAYFRDLEGNKFCAYKLI